eukprot:g801.t1
MMHGRKKKNSRKLPKVRAGSREAKSKLNSNASSIGNILDVLKAKLDDLEKEIRSDLKGKKDYEDQLHRLQVRRSDCVKRLEKNTAFAVKFDKDIGPFEKTYAGMTQNMEALYENAKLQHAKGVKLLKQEFKYHPMYKKPDSNFSAVPFRPM